MSLFKILLLIQICVCIAAASKKYDDKSPVVGFGVHRLRNFRNHYGSRLGAPGACEGIEELRFADAVLDNFAPINEQIKWANGGQRYIITI